MKNQRASVSLTASLPGSRNRKPTLDDKLDRVFQVAEHVDAKCVHLLGAASQRRRAVSQPRYYGYK
jgi:hypothetical protein